MIAARTAKIPPGSQLDLEQLRQDTMAMFALPLIAVSGIASWIALFPINMFRFDLQWIRFAAFFSLFVTGIGAYMLRARLPRLSRLLLLVGPSCSFTMALWAIPNPAVPFFAVLIVIANATLNPKLGLASALLNTLALVAIPYAGRIALPAVTLIWATLLMEWISSQGLYTVLAWAWNSQERATQLLERLRDHQGELNRTLAALTEANRRLQRIGHELTIARLRAEEARQLKEQFAANISHELRTPLNLILGFSEMMYFSPNVYGNVAWPASLRQDVRQIYQSSRQLLDLVNDVLDLSRIEAAQMPVQREPSDLRTVISEAVETVGDLLRGRSLALYTRLPPILPVLYFDRTRIRQVLLNLLNNAARFTEAGSITVSAEIRDREVVVSVADTGVGIPPEDLTRIFDEFHQVDMSLRRQREGAGLGLAISKRFIELHGGRIWAESQVGQGSTFFFSLPLPGEEVSIGRLISLTPPERPRAAYESTVILVDRDPAVASTLDRYLRHHHVIHAQDMDQARTLAAQLQPEALVLNVEPGTSAWSSLLQRGLDIVPPEVPVLVCSLPSQNWVAVAAAAQACLTKPISREQLLATLRLIDRVQEVLIVDDDRSFVQLIARFLESANGAYRVRWAYEGREALERIEEKRPDVVLLDLVMPGMDGFEFLDTLHADERWRDIPVVIVTATDYGEDILSQRPSTICLERKRGFCAAEVIRYVQAILDVAETVNVTHTAKAHPTSVPG